MHSVYVARGTYAGYRGVLYVGSTSRGMTRFHEHRNTEWWPHMTTTTWYHRESREAALKTERRLIAQLDPIFNERRVSA